MEDETARVELKMLESAFDRRILSFAIVNISHLDIHLFMNDAFELYKTEVNRVLESFQMIKSMAILRVEFEKKIITPPENVQLTNLTNSEENVQATIHDNNESNVNTESSSTNDNDAVNNIAMDEEAEQQNDENTTANEVDEHANENIGNVQNTNSDGDNDQTTKETLYLATSNKVITLSTNMEEHFETITEEISKALENSAFEGSGFTISRIIQLDVQVCSYDPLGGSEFIELPKKLKYKRAIINVDNNDEACFKWSILSALHPAKKNTERLYNYVPYEDELNFDGISFPVRLHDIDKFERQNNMISVNVYYYDEAENRVSPLRVSANVKENHIHLLLLFDETNAYYSGARTVAEKIKVVRETDHIRTHYCWIKNLPRLVSSQLSKHEHKKYICDRCLNFFNNEEKLNEHLSRCSNEYTIEMPNENDKWVQFKNYERQLKLPFVIYADTESLLVPLDENQRKNVFSESSSTIAYQRHIIFSIGYYFKCEYDDSKSFYASSGNTLNCVKWFINELELISQFAAIELTKNEPMEDLNEDDEHMINDPNAKCSICDKPFAENEKRVRDHDHLTSEFRGIAHNSCNLKHKHSRAIPIIMHNLAGYDAHLFIKELAQEMQGDIQIIPSNSEQYISFTKTVWNSTVGMNVREKIRLRFIDSFRFMAASLDSLASIIPAEKKRILHKVYEKEYSSEQISMLNRKGVFPYSYLDRFERLNETALPPKECFYNDLNDEEISTEDYNFACQIWEKFNIKTLGEYSELYLKTDVLLLADVFENFRETCYSNYELEAAHYDTAASLSFDAMLRYTRVKIELITDINMIEFVESEIRGGITQCSKRYAKANNKYMPDYDKNKTDSFLMYLDGGFFFWIFFIYWLIDFFCSIILMCFFYNLFCHQKLIISTAMRCHSHYQSADINGLKTMVCKKTHSYFTMSMR